MQLPDRHSLSRLAPLVLLVLAALGVALVAARGSGSRAGAETGGSVAEPSATVIATSSPVGKPSPGAIVAKPGDLNRPGFHLTFHDEFNGNSLDTTRWNTAMAWGRATRREQQYYLASAVSVKNGALTISADRVTSHGHPYTSGAITTYDSYQFRYGYVEARMKVPAGTGLVAAFWMLTRVHGPFDEIDTLETLGETPNTGYAVLHYGSTAATRGKLLSTYTGPDLSEGFHTYAVDWEPDYLAWYCDGIERYRTTVHVPAVPMYVISNVSVGGDWSGPPDQYTQFPAKLVIDYIRVYQRN